MTLDPVFSWIVAVDCALLLMSAVIQKVRRWPEFTAIVANYRVTPAATAPMAGALIAFGEGTASLLLLAPATRAIGAWAASALFLSYGAVIAVNLARGRTHIDCGCVGASKRRSIDQWMVWRNITLTVAAAVAALPTDARPLTMLDAFTVCGSVLAFALLYMAFDQLGAVTSRARIAT